MLPSEVIVPREVMFVTTEFREFREFNGERNEKQELRDAFRREVVLLWRRKSEDRFRNHKDPEEDPTEDSLFTEEDDASRSAFFSAPGIPPKDNEGAKDVGSKRIS
jgi:hypothetical protein